MSNVATLAQLKNQQIATAPAVTVKMGFGDQQAFELIQRAGSLLSNSRIVPPDYQGKDNMPNCVVALNMANRIGADPLMVMQNLVIVHNKPTWSSQFLIATVNTCGRFTSLRYEFFGEPNTNEWGCRAWAIEKETGEKLIGTDITIAIAKAEGWYDKKGSKWKTIPQQMLMYRAGAWWARTYAPELSMGLSTAEEVIDIIDVNPESGEVNTSTEKLRRNIKKVKPQPNETSDTIVNASEQAAQQEISEGNNIIDVEAKEVQPIENISDLPTVDEIEFAKIVEKVSTGDMSIKDVVNNYALTPEQVGALNRL